MVRKKKYNKIKKEYRSQKHFMEDAEKLYINTTANEVLRKIMQQRASIIRGRKIQDYDYKKENWLRNTEDYRNKNKEI